MADSSAQSFNPQAGTLSKEVERLVMLLTNEISNLDPVTINDYLLMATTDPCVGVGIELPMLLGAKKLGSYIHDDIDLQDFVRANFADMQGSLMLSFCEMWQAKTFGHSWSEISVQPKGTQWWLESILGVDQRYFRYAGSIGKIDTINYRTVPEGLKPIPYDKGIHIVNGRHLNLGRDPYGLSECKKAYPYWKAKKLILAQLMVAAQRQATPIIVGKTDLQGSSQLVDLHGMAILDDYGLPIYSKNGDRMKGALELIENQSVLVLDILDEITALSQQTDGAFFLNVLRFINSQILLAFLVPETVITTGSQGASGDSNLNAGHSMILDLVVSSFTDQIKEELVEKIARPLITWNFGEQENYGRFEEPEIDNTDNVALITAISGAATSGTLGAIDVDVINRSRNLADIPPIEEILMQQAKRYSEAIT